MGIDFLDIAFRLEKEFGIRIERGELSYCLTVSQMHWLIKEKLAGRNPPIPDVDAVFQRIGNELKKLPSYPKKLFKLFPGGDLENLLAVQDRESNWKEFGEALGVQLPPLESSGKLPKNVSTLSQLFSWLLEYHPETMIWAKPASTCPRPPDADKWTDELVWEKLKETLSDALGVDEAEIVPGARLIEDLGAE